MTSEKRTDARPASATIVKLATRGVSDSRDFEYLDLLGNTPQ